MERRAFLSVLTGGFLAAPLVVEAQRAAKVARIGYLAVDIIPDRSEAFRRGLRDLGYVEGRNVVIEYRDAEGKPERLRALVAELVALKVDVIVAPTTTAALAATQATRTLPIVFAGASDPVTSGLVTSLRGRAAMSRGCPSSARSWSASVWSCSRRPCRGSIGSLSSDIQAALANARERTC